MDQPRATGVEIPFPGSLIYTFLDRPLTPRGDDPTADSPCRAFGVCSPSDFGPGAAIHGLWRFQNREVGTILRGN